MPVGTQAIMDFYKSAVNRVKYDNCASYHKKEWQTVSDLYVTGNAEADGQIRNAVAGYFKNESQAEVQTAVKGEASSGGKMIGCTLTDYGKVAYASCTADVGRYNVTIVLQDDASQSDGKSWLQQIGSPLIWEKIEAGLRNVSALGADENSRVSYRNYTIRAVFEPNGDLVSMTHHADITVSMRNEQSVTITDDCSFYDFRY